MNETASPPAVSSGSAFQPLVGTLSNRWWRLNHLYWVEDKFGKKVRFRANWAQEQLFRDLWWLNVILKVRQIGISTFVDLLALDRCLFNSNQTCGIIDKTDDDAKRKLAKVEFAYQHLDDPDDPEIAPLGRALKRSCPLVVNNKKELEWANGSKIWCGMTMRATTVNFLHVSELGYIAANDPERAVEIAAGSFNAVHRGNFIVDESTHEGGRYGLNYELIRRAQACRLSVLTEMDWKFHFFGWPREPSYALPLLPGVPLRLTDAQARYFDRLEKETGSKLTIEQKHWWVKKSETPKMNMAQQYPATPEEALQAIAEGAIYGQEMSALRNEGRVRDTLACDGHATLLTAWDLGMSDYTSIWLLQLVQRDILVLSYHCSYNAKMAEDTAQLVKWEREYQRPITRHLLPHDANQRGKSGKTSVDLLIECGIERRAITVVPMTPDVWTGIKHLRGLLGRFYFDGKRCEREFETYDGRMLPSGLAALEGYHSKVEASGGVIVEVPVHDAASHGADALRCFSEGHLRGMLEGPSEVAESSHRAAHPVRVIKAGYRR